jgi:DNA-binding beta-propeller fold protein YncE
MISWSQIARVAMTRNFQGSPFGRVARFRAAAASAAFLLAATRVLATSESPTPGRVRSPRVVAFRSDVVPVAGTILHSYPLGFAFPYGVIFDDASGDLWIGDIGGDFGGDGLVHRVRTDGVSTGDTIDVREIGITPVDGAFDPATGMLWQLSGVHGIGCVNELDPVARVPTNRTICPPFEVQEMALAYDPATETFYAGSLDDTSIVRFDRNGTILDAAGGFPSISGLALNPATGHLFVLHRPYEEPSPYEEPNASDVLVLDPADGFRMLRSFFIGDGSWSAEMRGVELDCAGHLWLVSQAGASASLLEVDSGEASDCASARALRPTEADR